MAAMPVVCGSTLALRTFVLFFSTSLRLGVTFRVQCCQVKIRVRLELLGQVTLALAQCQGQVSVSLASGQLSVRLGLGQGQDQGQLRATVKVRLEVYLLVIFTSFLPSLLLLSPWRQNGHCLLKIPFVLRVFCSTEAHVLVHCSIVSPRNGNDIHRQSVNT